MPGKIFKKKSKKTFMKDFLLAPYRRTYFFSVNNAGERERDMRT